jgi:hypothetical protein
MTVPTLPAKFHVFRNGLVLLTLLALAGCGYIRYPDITSAQADFTITATPATAMTAAGSPAPALSFTVLPVAAFNGVVSVALTLQPGFTCAPVQCSAVLPSYNASHVLQLTPSSSTPPGTYQFQIVATSGALSHTISATLVVTAPSLAPDFSIAVSPTSSTVAAGTSAPPYSFIATPINGFNGQITVSATPPAGFSCAPSACSAALVVNQAVNALTFTPAATTPAGTYTLTFTATSGTLSHSVTATLVVTAASTPVTPDLPACAVAGAVLPPSAARTAFVYTGDPNPTSLLYDAKRNRILATNLQYNEIDIISPETMAVTQRLSVPQPMGIDLSTDGSTLIIGTRTHYFYRAAADTLCITDRQYLPILPPLGFDLSPMFPTALADGSILFAAYDVYSTEQTVYVWTEATGFVQPQGLLNLLYSVRNIVPSGDRMHAFISGDDDGGVYGRYDVPTRTAIEKVVDSPNFPVVYAVNQDGSKVLLDKNGLTVVDSNFNTLVASSGSGTSLQSGIAAEPDFSRFYLLNFNRNYITLTDGNFNPTGAIPADFEQDPFISSVFGTFGGTFDGEHRLLALTTSGIALLSTATVSPVPAANASWPALAPPGDVYGTFTPPDPESGLTTTLNGGGFPSLPSSVTLSEGSTTESATGLTGYTASAFKLTVPSFPSDCADVTATFSGGTQAFAPQAFCYTPKVFVVDGDSGPAAGGSTLTLYGLGFGEASTPTVTVGGVASPNVTQKLSYGTNGSALGLSTLTVVVPPHPAGDADIAVVTSFGSTVLKNRFHYVQRSDTALPAGANPVQLLLDSTRGRVLITDAANNQLLVYALASGALLNKVSTGSGPQGMALTPDASQLLVTSAGDYKVSVLDASSYATLQQATIPATTADIFGPAPVGYPIQVATMAGQKAYIVTQAGYLQGTAGAFSPSLLFDYDIAANTLTPDPVNRTELTNEDGFYIASSSDGSTALIGNTLAHAVGSPTTASDTTLASFYDLSLAPDASVNAVGAQFFDNSFHWQNNQTADNLITPQQYYGLGETLLYGAQFNGSGSLFFRPSPHHLRIYDTHHGNLVRTLQLPDSFVGSNGTATTSPTRLLAVNPAGQQVIAVTTAGLSVFTFASDPLSLGEANLASGTLTLLGSGFSASTTVLVDTLPLPAAFVSSTELTVTLPTPAPGAHSVTLTNPNGDTYTLTLAFTTP